jgi:hypothetical protein
VIGFDETRFDNVLRFLMESRGLRCPEELSRLLGEAGGREVPAERITAYMEGREWVDGDFPRWVAEALDLGAWEMGVLAYAVAYGQVRQPP